MLKYILILLLLVSPLYCQSRGEVLNNPGLLRSGKILIGETCKDSDGFSAFRTPEQGLRAMRHTLRNYGSKWHVDTIRGLVERYTRADTKPKEEYIEFLCKRLKVEPEEKINLKNKRFLKALIKGMIYWENGGQIYSDKFFDQVL